MSRSKTPMGARSLTMNRSGEFHIRATGDSHCGVSEELDVKYTMVCVCDATTDERGFLFDQINVDNFFKSIRRSQLSCELLCIDCGKRLLDLIKKENPKCVIRSIKLTLSPAPYAASMTFDWEAAKPKKVRKPFIDFKF